MTSSVLPPFSSKVTVVTGPRSPPSSLVQTRREFGVTSRYVPKNAIASCSNSRRYPPPTRTSISQESRDAPLDFGAHHRLKSSGLVHASNTMRAGPLKVRVTTSSRSDFRSTVVRFFMGVGSLSLLATIGLLLPFQFLYNLVQLVEACVPEPAVPLDPCRLFLQSAQAEPAGPHAPDLLRGDEPSLLQNADMLLHPREGHVKLLGKVRDRSVSTPELLQNAASGGVRERGERGIEAGPEILNHVVQYLTHGLAACKRRPSGGRAGGYQQVDGTCTGQQRNAVSGGAVTAVSVPEPRDLVDHARRGAGHGLRCPAPRSSSRRLAVAVRLQHQDYPLLFASHAARAASLAATAS